MNPFDGGGSKQGAPNKTIAPMVPAHDGNQFARDSMTPEEIGISRDAFWNEIPSDRTSHTNATPEHSNATYVGRQYDTIVRSPSGNQYGAMAGQMNPSKSTTDVPGSQIKLGDES